MSWPSLVNSLFWLDVCASWSSILTFLYLQLHDKLLLCYPIVLDCYLKIRSDNPAVFKYSLGTRVKSCALNQKQGWFRGCFLEWLSAELWGLVVCLYGPFVCPSFLQTGPLGPRFLLFLWPCPAIPWSLHAFNWSLALYLETYLATTTEQIRAMHEEILFRVKKKRGGDDDFGWQWPSSNQVSQLPPLWHPIYSLAGQPVGRKKTGKMRHLFTVSYQGQE